MKPYRTTPVFDQDNLPDALRRAHNTKEGVWGLIRVLQGELLHLIADPPGTQILSPDHPGLVAPGQVHRVEPLGPMRMQVEFYDAPPSPA